MRRWIRSQKLLSALLGMLLGGMVLGTILFVPVMAQQVAIAPVALQSAQILVTATAAAGSAATATLAPPAGSYTYITAYELTMCGDATGDAAGAVPITMTFAGFTTNMVHKMDSTHTAGVCYSRFYSLTNPIRSAATGSAVAQTITSGTTAHMIPNINVYGFYSPTVY